MTSRLILLAALIALPATTGLAQQAPQQAPQAPPEITGEWECRTADGKPIRNDMTICIEFTPTWMEHWEGQGFVILADGTRKNITPELIQVERITDGVYMFWNPVKGTTGGLWWQGDHYLSVSSSGTTRQLVPRR